MVGLIAPSSLAGVYLRYARESHQTANAQDGSDLPGPWVASKTFGPRLTMLGFEKVRSSICFDDAWYSLFCMARSARPRDSGSIHVYTGDAACDYYVYTIRLNSIVM